MVKRRSYRIQRYTFRGHPYGKRRSYVLTGYRNRSGRTRRCYLPTRRVRVIVGRYRTYAKGYGRRYKKRCYMRSKRYGRYRIRRALRARRRGRTYYF